MKRALIAIAFLLCIFGTLLWGEVPIEALWQVHPWNPLLEERLPRVLVLIASGASLAVAGAVMQALFQNPLAAPTVLGISCGGTLCAIPLFILNLQNSAPYAIPLAAFIGCLTTLLLVYGLAKRRGIIHTSTLVLTGIAISTLFLALQYSLLYALRDRWQLMQLIVEWETGTTADRNWNHVHMQLPLTLIGLWGCWYYRRELNILSLGDEEALNLGVDIIKVRWRLFLCVALLTAATIAAVGNIAYFGLLMPHLLRKIYGGDNRQIIPACIWCGALVFTVLDLSLRILGLHALTVGNISALLGGCFFLYLLQREDRQEYA